MISVAEVLERLFDQATLQSLTSNDAFLSALAQALPASLRTHHEEKLAALRNAVVNAAIGSDPSDEQAQTFIRLIDELTPSHLTLLAAFNRRERELFKVESFAEILQLLGPQLSEWLQLRDRFRAACQDLQSRYLIRIAPGVEEFPDVANHTMVTVIEPAGAEGGQALPQIRVTDLGKEFLQFISDPDR